MIASSIVSGRFLPLVSGMKKVSNPASVTKLPIIKRGNGFQIVAKDSIKSPKNPPKPPIAEPIPTVVLLMGVGKSSAVIVNKILIAAETKSRTIIDKTICNTNKDSLVPINATIKQLMPIGNSHKAKVFLLPNLSNRNR